MGLRGREDLLPGTTVGGIEPEQTRLSHVLSLSSQIGSPIQAIGFLIDNSVQQFYSQIVNQLNIKRGPPLRIDISLVELDAFKPPSQAMQSRSVIQHLMPAEEESKQSLAKAATNNAPITVATPPQTRSKACLKITDNGPGISPFRMRQFLTQFGREPSRVSLTGSAFELAEHGVGVKLSTFRLGRTALILSKTSPQG